VPEVPEPPPSETPDRDGAFPRLSAEQIELLGTDGERRPANLEDVFVLLTGEQIE